MKNMLKGLGVSGYRSFGPDPQLIAPLGKINIFAGQNNSGKSNILRIISLVGQLNPEVIASGLKFDRSLDLHKGKRAAIPSLYLPFPITQEAAGSILTGLSDNTKQSELSAILLEIVKQFPRRTGEFAWFEYQLPKLNLSSPSVEEMVQITSPNSSITPNDWQWLWARLTSQGHGNLNVHHIPETLAILSPLRRLRLPTIAPTIEANRQIGAPESDHKGLSGLGIIKKLANLERPPLERQEDKQLFEKMNHFVKSVTGYQDARLEIPREVPELLVEMGGRLLPVASLGTGIHQVILFAAAATLAQDSIVCIEEPETHLHPRLQKKLLSYLRETNNQYFITTHSAHLLDAQDTAVFHVRLNEDEESIVEPLRKPSDRASVCFDLGYRPSDLVQANSIIWVEGPSDRVYLNAWIEAIDPNLEEGVHYSIMFYGGRLLAHLSALDSDECIDDFIDLLRLNRNVAVVIDSDKRKSSDSISATKQRLSKEVEGCNGVAWVSAGREIENYCEPETLKNVLKTMYPAKTFVPARNQWDCCYKVKADKTQFVNKVRLAREVTKNVDLNRLDLKARVSELVDFIKRCNR